MDEWTKCLQYWTLFGKILNTHYYHWTAAAAATDGAWFIVRLHARVYTVREHVYPGTSTRDTACNVSILQYTHKMQLR